MRKKADWYTSRDLGEVVSETPYHTIRLNFEPQGSGHDGDPFYLLDKENKCVVCGATENLTKHHCVPYVFRKHFPVSEKNHQCHDVLAVCSECHTKYEPYALELKTNIAKQHSITVHPSFVWNRDVHQAAKFANALRRYRDRMPPNRIKEIEKWLSEYFDGQELTQELLDKALSENSLYRKTDKPPEYGKFVVEQTSDLDAFLCMWRQHFVDTMSPQFMPAFWSVNHKPKRPTVVSSDID